MESVQKFLTRRTESADAAGIAKLVKRHTESLFGRVNAEHIIEHANLSVSLVSVEGDSDILGHMSFTDQPPSLSLDWGLWLKHNYNLSQATPVNTLFLCLFVAKDNFHQGACAEILRTVFMTAPLLQYLFLIVPRETNIGSALSATFSAVQCVSESATVDLYVTHRHAHFPALAIRGAKVEDTDDLMPVLLQHSPDIQALYGDYFLSELIASQDDQHRTLVAEVDGRAVGMLSVSTQVDVDLLAASYMLESYHCLRSQHADDEILSLQGHSVESLQASKVDTSPDESSAHTSTPAQLKSTVNTSTGQQSVVDTSTGQQSTVDTSAGQQSTSHTSTPQDSTSNTSQQSPAINTPQASSAHTATPHASTADVLPTDYGSSSNVAELAERSKVSEPRWEYRLKGSGSALAVQLFAIDDRYEMRSVDFLPAVFKLFPDHDFLVLTQPHSTGDFPLLAHFMPVPPRPGTSLPQELYLMHKCSLLHSFEVAPVCDDDIAGVEALLTKLRANNLIVQDVMTTLRGRREPGHINTMTALVAKCAGQIVGLAVLTGKQDMEYIQSHYNVEDFIYYNYHQPTEHAQLHHLILNPVFSPYAKHFIKEVLRLSETSCLYYHLSQPKPSSLISTLHCLVPIKGRRQVVYPEGLGVNAPLPEVTEVKPPYTLFHTNRKLTFEPKISINCRVVVVGASQTGLSLIENLAFCPHLHFSNLTVVSPTGLGPSPDQLSLDTWVSSVQGKVTAINRTEQCVEVTRDGLKTILHYDWLVLTCGLQYTAPMLNGVPPPSQVVTSVHSHCHGPYVVYGSGLDAYTAVHQLLVNEVAPDQITLVTPSTVWSDQVIIDRVHNAVSSSDVRLITDCTLTEWTVGEEGLTAITLNSTEHAQNIPCRALVYLEDKAVDSNAFKALNDACLAFDSRLVVGVDHSTNDPNIFAAGPLTKFSRKYRVGNCSHADFNSEEVGMRLALTLLSKLDPTFDPEANRLEDDLLIPRYSQPNIVSGPVPGGLSYLHISAPPTPGAGPSTDKGRELSTDTDSGYFRVHVSQYGCIDELSMLSSKPLTEKSNYVCLYNMHEKYLNNLVGQFDEGLISDLYTYFREPWACALFHDRFPDFVQEVTEYLSMLPHKTDSELSIEDRVRELVEDEQDLIRVRPQLIAQFNSSPAKSVIADRLFKFLDYNKQTLPMYAKPDPM